MKKEKCKHDWLYFARCDWCEKCGMLRTGEMMHYKYHKPREGFAPEGYSLHIIPTKR